MANPTLTLDVPDGPITFRVRFDRWDGPKPQFWYRIESGKASHEATDLRLGASATPSLSEALRSLVEFFGAFALPAIAVVPPAMAITKASVAATFA